MIDYDLPLVDFDRQELYKKAIAMKDSEGNEFIKYKELLEEVKPRKKQSTDIKQLERLVTKVQAVWRGHVIRKRYNSAR
jgi:hypothetical protein